MVTEALSTYCSLLKEVSIGLEIQHGWDQRTGRRISVANAVEERHVGSTVVVTLVGGIAQADSGSIGCRGRSGSVR